MTQVSWHYSELQAEEDRSFVAEKLCITAGGGKLRNDETRAEVTETKYLILVLGVLEPASRSQSRVNRTLGNFNIVGSMLVDRCTLNSALIIVLG
jgi:hypothetical protein